MEILIGYDGSRNANAAIATAGKPLVHRTRSPRRVWDVGRERPRATTRIGTGNRRRAP